MEEAFAYELQLLTHKVISKKPNFHHTLDATLKQQYANQLYDCNSISIAKTSLLQMPKVTFMQFRNELARVIGTHQHYKISGKAVLVSAVETYSGDGKMLSKAQWICGAKVSTQSSQIKDLCSKLDAAITDNSQMQEFLNPLHCEQLLPMQCKPLNLVIILMVVTVQVHERASLSWVNPRKDGATDPKKTCRYCKDTSHELDNCLCFHARKIYWLTNSQRRG